MKIFTSYLMRPGILLWMLIAVAGVMWIADRSGARKKDLGSVTLLDATFPAKDQDTRFETILIQNPM